MQIIQIPLELNVGAEYGLVVLKTAAPAAQELSRFIVSEEGKVSW